jgi:transmembrane sensor
VSNSAPSDAPLRLEPVASDEIDRRLAWRAPRLELSQTALADIVESLNRANHVQLVIADAKLADLRLTGVLRADRAEDFVRLLETHYGVRAERPGPGHVVLRRGR